MTQSRGDYAVLLLNYNHWEDTLECLSSLYKGSVLPKRVVVCDNGSTDGSLERLAQAISAWDGIGPHNWRRIARSEAEGSDVFPEELLLVDVGGNLGYAGGNNVGLRLLLRLKTPFVWLLNNDTVVDSSTGSALLEYMHGNDVCGICGALTRYQHSPEIVQCYGGGWYDGLWGIGGLYGEGDHLPLGTFPEHTPEKLEYVNGASVFIRREFLLDVGLLEEAYFLYCEEWDWAERAKGRWELCWTPQAEVLHKEGLSTGVSNRRGLKRHWASSLRLLRSRLFFVWKFHPWALPLALAAQCAVLVGKRCLGLGKRG